jgi:hypothetical protein
MEAVIGPSLPTRKAWPQPSAVTSAATTPSYSAKRIDRVQEIASDWKLSIDTGQRLFANEPDVFVIQSGRKRTLRIPYQVKERVWRRMTNKPRGVTRRAFRHLRAPTPCARSIPRGPCSLC